MLSENIFEILSGDEEVRAVTSYTTAEIWEKRPFLSGSADHKSQDSMIVDIVREEKVEGQIIENSDTQISGNPAIEYRPIVKKVEEKKMANVYWTQVTSQHDYNDLLRRWNSIMRGKTAEKGDAKLIDTIKEWSLSIYDGIVNLYVDACEKALGNALSMQDGWVVHPKPNQAPFQYNPNIEHNHTGSILDFDDGDPALLLYNDLVLKSNTEGYSPNVIFVGDAIARAILQSQWYNNNNRTAPISQAFYFQPKMSTNTIRAKGALELIGITVGGCKIVWLNSMQDGIFNFKPNCAVALNEDQFATIYSGPTYANMALHTDIVRFDPAPIVNEKQIRYYCEYSYLPVVNRPGEIFRAYYN